MYRLVWLGVIFLHGALGLASIVSNQQPRGNPQQQLAGQQQPIPITVLSGFLGSGKTTLLQHLLNNNQGLRIAVIVNDVASVNIDSKLIASSDGAMEAGVGPAGMVQLQNGCACCSKSEELLSSVSELVMLSDLKGEELGFQHIVVEMSGVADPKSVRAKFQEAILYDMPLMDRVRLDTMVTLVDCSSFLSYLVSAKSATPEEAPELFYPNGQLPTPSEPTIDWMEGLPAPLLEALMAGEAAYSTSDESWNSPDVVDSGIADLLVAQTETADVVLLNKIDLVEEKHQRQISQVVMALNPRATIYQTQYGNLPLNNILGVAGGRGVVEAGVVDDHRDAVEAALKDSSCVDPACTDPNHSHGHDHASVSQNPTSRNVEVPYFHVEPQPLDVSTYSSTADHLHTHTHTHDHDACMDPDCSHPHDLAQETHAGIGTFVYQARRPFHPQRLLSLLRKLPVVRGLPTEEDDDSSYQTALISKAACDALKRTLRSKGFVWCADSNIAALYWSHAGSSFDMQCLGRWWSTLSREQWPAEAVASILADFDDPMHSEESDGDTVGDRRQEIVFIGQKLGQREDQQSLKTALDSCLLDDGEWAVYRSNRKIEHELKEAFVNPISARVVSY